MAEPFFSTIIPVYNRAALVRTAIDSALAQSAGDQEIIVVDDGSTDGTPDVLRQHYGDRIRLLEQSNAGPGPARNTGIRAARGKFVAFLDSDDLWFPQTLQTYRDAIGRWPEARFFAGRGQEFSSRKAPVLKSNEPLNCDYFPDYFAASDRPLSITGCAVVVRRETLLQSGLFADQHMNGEDNDLWLRLGSAGGFAYLLNPPVVAHRKHASSEVVNLDLTLRGIRWMIEEERAGRYPGGNARRADRLRIITRHIRPVILRLLREGRIDDARDLYWQAASWHLRIGKLRFLLGVPPMLAWRSLRKKPDGHRTAQ